MGATPDRARGEPPAQVRLEAELLTAALAERFRRRGEPGERRASATERTSGGAGDPDPDPANAATDGPHPGGSADSAGSAGAQPGDPAGTAPRGEHVALSEILAGAGLVARGGLELMGGVMSRLLEVSASPPDRTPAGRHVDAASEADREAAGPPRVVSYRRSPRRRVPVDDAAETTDLA